MDYNYILNFVYSFYLIVGAAGGLYFLIDNIRNRIRIKIRNLKEIYSDDDKWEPRQSQIIFEITNIGKYITSLEPEIFLNGYEPEGKKIYGIFEVYDKNRDLQPHIPKEIHASAKDDIEKFEYLWFKTYTFQLTRGRKKRIHYDCANMNVINYWGYIYKLFLFKFLNRYKRMHVVKE